ncbi:MAG TPA: ATP-binding cassette domain-containing protein [Methanocorpusculum sp.]|nr:ATP-binding cassette domain-containing protein [Methanocorpusculum sp.]
MFRIETKDLCYSYPSSKESALNGINFTAGDCQRIAVLGPNGAGKSTLFKHFNGILTPSSGIVLIDGEPITKKNLGHVRRKIGVVFQNPDDQIFSSTVEQDIAFGPHNLGLSEEDAGKRVDEVIHMLGLEDLRTRAPHHLSGGEKKRVAIAGILAMQPEVLILDEPTAGLDPVGVTELFSFLNSIPETLGCTVIYSTHQVELVPEMADLVYVMKKGTVAGIGTPSEIFLQEDLLKKARLELPPLLKLTKSLKESGIELEDACSYSEVERAVLHAFGKEPRNHQESHAEVHVHGDFHSHPHYHHEEE